MANNTKMAEEKIKYDHHLLCVKCHFKFQIESEESNNTKIKVDKMQCPVCASAIQLDPALLYTSLKPSAKAQAKMNIEASREALRMANEMKRADADAGVGKMIPVLSYQAGKERGQTQMIPKKVIDSIEEKVKPIVENIEE